MRYRKRACGDVVEITESPEGGWIIQAKGRTVAQADNPDEALKMVAAGAGSHLVGSAVSFNLPPELSKWQMIGD